MISDRFNPVVSTLDNSEALPTRHTPQAQAKVICTASYLVSLRVNRDRIYGVIMPLQSLEALLGTNIPQPNCTIYATASQDVAVIHKGDR
jgi:hypothetical protein